MKSIGYDDAFNYKTAKGGIEGALVQLCPNGIDIYFGRRAVHLGVPGC